VAYGLAIYPPSDVACQAKLKPGEVQAEDARVGTLIEGSKR